MIEASGGGGGGAGEVSFTELCTERSETAKLGSVSVNERAGVGWMDGGGGGGGGGEEGEMFATGEDLEL